ncbi:metallophosphoesterase [Leeia sp.]|uniref:metallophosphoesterase family protein n=1 Tax=Leeia sp. TaxID=2884678 RepID=UPI0035AF6E69
MRIAVLSDIHGNLLALEAVVADLRRQGCDAVVNLGDTVSGPLQPQETAQFLMAQPGWVHVAGNHERQLLNLHPGSGPSDRYAREQLGEAELAWLAAQHHSQRLTDEVWLCHGSPGSDVTTLLQTGERPASPQEIEARLGHVSAELILCGHSHIPRNVRTRQGQWIVNPGSVGLQAYRDDHPWPHVVENGSPDARYALVERLAAGQWRVELRSVPYAHEAAAALAVQRQRLEWAQALRTGYLS